MDWNTLVLLGIFAGVFIYIIYGIIVKTREFLVVPVKKAAIFNEIVEKDGFDRLQKESEDFIYLKDQLETQFKKLNFSRNIEIRDTIFKDDRYPFYVSDIIFDCRHLTITKDRGYMTTGNHLQLWKTRHIILYIDSPLRLDAIVDIKKRGDGLYYITFDPESEVKSDDFSKEIKEAYAIYSMPDITKKILTPEVLELLEKQNGIFPFTDNISNETPGHFNRDLIISDRGIILIGNPDGSRKDIAVMLEFGKRLMSILEILTRYDSDVYKVDD